MFLSAAILAVAVAPQTVAGCGSLLKKIEWHRMEPGAYSTGEIQTDFSPLRFWRGDEYAKVTTVDGDEALDIMLEKGCYTTGEGHGCGLYARSVISPSDAITMEYTVKFGENFDWVRGGKLLGLCSGTCPTGCSPPSDASQGFSARLMWTDNVCTGNPSGCTVGKSGGMHIYSYFKGMNSKSGSCGQENPFQVNGKDWVVQSDEWYTIRLVAKMNTPGQSNGALTAYVDGQRMASASGLDLRGSSNMGIDQFMFDTFFGGSQDMGAAKNEHLYFKSLYIWEGDCSASGRGGSGGSGRGGSGRAVGESGGGGGGWKQRTIDPSNFGASKGVLKTTNLEVGTIYNGGFCASFEVENPSGPTCQDMAVEININPSLFALRSITPSMKVLAENKQQGWTLIVRNGYDPETAQGDSHKGQFCANSNVKAIYTAAQIKAAFSVNSVCDGESIWKSKSSTSAV